MATEVGRAPLHPVRPQGLERPRHLEELRPWRVVGDVARCYGLIALAFALLIWCDAWWAYALAFVTIGTQQYTLALIEHDGKHGTLMRPRQLNDLFARLLICAPIGVDIDFALARDRHREHHRWIGAEQDPIRGKYAADDKATPTRFAWFLTGVPSLTDDLTLACRVDDRTGTLSSIVVLLRRWAAVIGAQIVICAAVTRFLPWWHYAAFWLAPIYPLVFLASKVRTFCDHGHPVLPDTAADGRRLITYRPTVLERLFISPVNMHYHAAHHLWPAVPYYNLRRLNRHVGSHTEIEMRGSYARFLWAYCRSLPLMSGARALTAPAQPR